MTKHNKIRNILFASVSALCVGLSSASAVENVVKVGAVVEVQGIHYTSNGDATQKKTINTQEAIRPLFFWKYSYRLSVSS